MVSAPVHHPLSLKEFPDLPVTAFNELAEAGPLRRTQSVVPILNAAILATGPTFCATCDVARN